MLDVAGAFSTRTVITRFQSRVQQGAWLLAIALILVCGGVVAESPAVDKTGSVESGKTQSGFPERPADVDAQTWNGLHTAVQQAKLLPRPDGIAGPNGQFGYSVSVDGSRALIGGYNLAGTGAALVLADSGSGWVEEAVLLPSDGESGGQGDEFGISVSLSGDRALVGNHGDDNNGVSSGSAYIFNGLVTIFSDGFEN